jgi:hypothetical protein
MRILSLGAGEQSTAVYFLAALGEIPPLDFAVFADTGEEPAWVYETVRALSAWRHPETGRGGAPVLVRWLTDEDGEQVRLGDQLIDGNAGRFASIPAYIKHLLLYVTRGKHSGKPAQGKSKRQCTREFKVEMVERTIRREILGLAKGEAYRGPRITQVFGFDRTEGERIFRTKGRLAGTTYSEGDFPLWDLELTRADCREYLKNEVPGWGGDVLPSACTFCPLVNNAFRRLVRDRDPAGWARACAVDAGLRAPGAAASKMLDGELYVHRTMKPLSEVDIDKDEDEGMFPAMTGKDCEGYCGH